MPLRNYTTWTWWFRSPSGCTQWYHGRYESSFHTPQGRLFSGGGTWLIRRLRWCSRLVTAVQQPWGVALNLDLSLNPSQYSVVNNIPPCHLKDWHSDFFRGKKTSSIPTCLTLPTSHHNLAITFNDMVIKLRTWRRGTHDTSGGAELL